MHGIIFDELRSFAESAVGEGGWEKILEKAGLQGKEYQGIQAYPDEEAVKIVGAACEVTGLSAPDVLRAFGKFVAKDLMGIAAPLLQDGWTSLDVIEHTEETVHSVVRLDNPGAEPPKLQVTRDSDSQVTLVYSSERKMCDIAKGIAEGLGEHFGETISVSEDGCMNDGAGQCKIIISKEN